MADHFVDIRIDRYGTRPQFRCTATDQDDVATAPCRWYCSPEDCAEQCVCEPVFGSDGYLQTDYSNWTDHLDYCRFIECWFDDDPWWLYDGPPTNARSGPVTFRWEGDTYSWRYTENQPALAEAAPDSPKSGEAR